MIARWRARLEGEAFRRTVFMKLLLSFMCILMIPVIIGALLYNKMEQVLIDNANESNQVLLEQTRLSIDSRMNEVDQLSAQIAFNPTLQLLLYEDSNQESIDEYTYIELIKNLKRYRTLSPYIDDYYVYLKHSDQILSSSIRTDPHLFYNHIQTYRNRSDKQMIDLLSSYHLKAYLPSEPITYSLKQRNMITSVTSLPMGEETDVRGALVVMIDESELLGLLKKTDKRNTEFYILNEELEVLCATSPASSAITSILPELSAQHGDFNAELNGKSVMISYTKSGQNNWTYISVLPKDILLSKVNETKSLAGLLVMVCFTAGLACSYYFAYKNHRPIRELIQTILQGKNMPDIEIKNEITFIKNELMTSIDEEKKMRLLLVQQAPVIQSDFISRLIKGYVDTKSLTANDLEFMDVRFNHRFFGVVLIQIDDCRRFIQEDTEREWTLMRFILINLSNELLSEFGYAIELERSRVGIMLNHAQSKAESGNDLDAVLNQLHKQMELKFKINVTIAVSSLKHGIDQIAVAYGEAVTALEYNLLPGQSSVIYYGEVKDTEHHYFYYSLETESQLMNYAKSGDYGSVAKVLDHVFEINFKTRAISPEMGKCLFFEQMNTVLKLFYALNMDDKLFFGGEGDPVKYITRIGSADKMNETLKQLYKAICDKVEEERTDHSEQLITKIRRFIQEQYASNDLSLTSIADYCGLNPSYLSTFYKKQSGHNLTEYITSLRIKRAKAYLEEGEWTVSQIALMVGFSNDIGLIRVFKKSEGITPGKYREIFRAKGIKTRAFFNIDS
ncbi:helix-turn-helix domain-containing protein [Paenibacillus harenae]|uniref:helix-turn-helix domain-containing protein n=1 Tax=Paenibacillus harenae TaxID=306543 RepID=UPI00040E1193|nr:helix-turn-helix domain-containing protein [Paenibacillus harenae]